MFDLVSLLTGAGLVLGGYGSGRLGKLRRHPKPPKPPKPICGCGHHHSFHDDAGCKHVEQETVYEDEVQRDGKGRVILDSWDEPVTVEKVRQIVEHKCGCRHYSGPVPYPEYYAPEFGG